MKRKTKERMYLALVAIYERHYDEAGIHTFRVRARSTSDADELAETIVGTERWWQAVHGNDIGSREETVVGEPVVMPIPSSTFRFRPLISADGAGPKVV